MRFNHRKVLVGIIVALFGILAACGGNSKVASSPTSSAKLILSPSALAYSAIVGDAPYTVSITATKDDPAVADSFTVKSSNTAVATVSLSGSTAIIAPIGAGTANIVITSGSGVTQTIVATIATDQTQLTLSPAALTYAAIAGSSPYSVTVAATKKDGVTAGTFTVASSNTKVATASASGNVVTITPVGAGTANIVFTAGSNTSVTKTIVATIAADQTAVTLTPSSTTYSAFVGDPVYTVTVNAVKNDGITPDTFSVASSKPAVVTAVANGNQVTITPVSAGTADIVFTSGSNSKVTRTIAATIHSAVPQLTLSPDATSYTAHVGGASYDVTVTAIKSDGITSDTFTAVSDAPGVVSVSPTGTLSNNAVVKLTPVAAGVANITFTATSSGLSTSVKATISSDQTALTLSPSALSFSSAVGGTPYTVTVTAVEADGTTPDTFTVASSDTTIATTSPSGTLASGTVVTVTPVAPGTANIVFTSSSEPSVTTTVQATITAQSVSGCDGTEWFCDDFQGETVGATTASKWDLTQAANYGTFAVATDANVPANKVLAYTGNSSVNGSVIGLIPDSVWKPAMDNHTGDYYVEARINVSSSKKNKQVYLLSRYQLDGNSAEFYNAGLNLNGRSEVGYAGNVKLASGGPTVPALNTWYTVHFEMVGNTASLYVDGVLQTLTVNKVPGTSYTYPDANALTAGKVGLYADNNSFQIDDVRVGAVQLALSPNALAYSAAAGSAPYLVNVTAVKPDGVTADTFAVASDTPTVATATMSGNVVTITPLQVGTANVTITSGSNPKITRTIAVTVTAAVVTKATISVSPSTAYTPVVGGATDVVTVTAHKSDNSADTFTAASSNSAVASVAPSSGASGAQVTITPVAAGTATITFTSGSDSTVTTTIAVTVTAAPKATISVSPSTPYSTFAGGAAEVVTVTAHKGDNSSDTFTVASSDSTVASVSPSSGTSGTQVSINPLAVGTATITFTSGSDSTITTTIAVTVTAAPKATISVSPSTAYTPVVGGATDVVTVTAHKSDSSADTFTAVSSDSTVASVSPSSGASGAQVTITPVAVGTATITFTSGSDSTITTTIAVTVTAAPKATIAVSPSTPYSTFAGGAAEVVMVTANKGDNSSDTFTVASSDSTVASVSPSSGTSGTQVSISPLAVGTATITFTSGSDSTITTTIAVTVTANSSALTLTPPTTNYTSNVGGSAHVVIISALKPDGTTQDGFTVSANDNGAVVTTAVTDDQLTITPVAVGTSTITITSTSGKTTTITLTVISAVSHCDGTEWFCDDFQGETVGNTTVANWDLKTTPGGTFKVVQDADNPANTALQYSYGTETAGAVIGLIKDSVWTNVAPRLNATGDYYVEAHLKPQQIGHNKQLYMISHYTDTNNYYGGGYNYTTPRLETAYESNGTFTAKYAQGLANSALPAVGTQGGGAGKEGTWVTVRFEVINGTGTMYANGVAESKTVKKFPAVLTSGKIGLYTDYNNFLIDDIRVGEASQKPTQPAQLTVKSALGATVTAYTAEVGDAVTPITVTALKGDNTADTYYVASSNPAVVTATVDSGDSTGKTVDLTPISPGTANIIFFSASDPNVSVTVPATVGPQFVQPTTVYSLSGGELSPAPGATNAYIDDHLVLTFDSAPTLNTTGSVRIFKVSDDTLVDVIPLTGAIDYIGQNSSSNVRVVNTNPVWVSGNSVVIAPHQSKLLYDTNYYVAISDGSITGILSGQTFTGIGKVGGWNFTTKDAPASGLTTLAVNGTGTTADFRTVQGALNYAMQQNSTSAYTSATPLTINVASGIYQELLFLRNVNYVTINGAGQSQTTIQYENYDSKAGNVSFNTGSGSSSSATAPTLTGGRSVFLVEGSDMLTLTNLTLKNTHLRQNGPSNQAETIYFNSDSGRLVAKNAEFDSEQDTLLLKGYNWFYNTLITGNVDYIWGYSHVALFESSEIRTVGDSLATQASGGYLVQARVASLSDKGYIFLNSSLTYGPGPGGQVVANGTNGTASTYLARSGGSSGAYDNVLYINCKMDTHIAPLGWAAPNINSNPNPTPATATASSGWREFGSLDMFNNLLNVTSRSTYSYQMTPSDITTYGYDTRANIFAAYPGGWNPQ